MYALSRLAEYTGKSAYLDAAFQAFLYEKTLYCPEKGGWRDLRNNKMCIRDSNQGVVSLNLPQMGIVARGDEEKFWKIFDERLELCYEALMLSLIHISYRRCVGQ